MITTGSHILCKLRMGVFATILLCAAMGAVAQSSTHIPLTLYDATFNQSNQQTGEIRVGIDVSIGGGAFESYIFDTGSSPLVALNTVDIGSATVVQSSVNAGPVMNNTGILKYGATSGNDLDFIQYQASVQLGNSSGPTISNVSFAYGQSSSNTAIDSRFSGITGVNLAAQSFTDMGTAQEHGNFDLFSMIGDLDTPVGTTPGFMISLKNPNRAPGVYVGLTNSMLNEVEMAIAMTTRSLSGPATFPNSGNTIYGHDNFTVSLDISDGVNHRNDPALAISMDTGAPSMFIRVDNASELADFVDPVHTSHLKQGVTLDLDGATLTGYDPLMLLFQTLLLPNPSDPTNMDQAMDALRQVEVVGDPGDTHMNTGLYPFLNYDIVFNMDDSGSNVGYVGFVPIPEPSVAMLLLWASVFTCMRRRSR